MFSHAPSIMPTALPCIRLCGGQNSSLGSVCIPIPGHYGYVTLHGKKDCVDVVTLRWEDFPGLSGGPHVITRVLKTGEGAPGGSQNDAAGIDWF